MRAEGPGELAARIAAVPADARIAVVDPRFVGHRHALRLALTDPRFPAGSVPGALGVGPDGRAELVRAVAALEAGAGQIPAARQPVTAPEAAGVAPAGREAAHPAEIAPAPAALPAAATQASRGHAGDSVRTAGLPDTLAHALLEAGVAVHHVELGALTATVPADEAERDEAVAAVAAVDDEQVRLRSAVKSRDGFFTTFFISPYSRYLARWCARRGLTPNQVTTASLLVALVAAGCAATGTRPGFAAAGVLLIASFVLDCTDGQLARYSLQYSTLGAWLDATFDRVKEYAYYAGLALGAARGGDDVWALALGAMVLQTCRHVVDFSFNEANHDATANTSPTAALSDRLDSVGWTVWARRMIVLPIGERWALIAVLTAVTTPRTVFCVLLAGCALAACYTTAGRVLRSLTRKARRTDRAARALADLADSGPLAEAVARIAPAPPAFAAPVLALLGTAAAVATAWLAPYGSWWPVAGAVGYALTSGLAVAGAASRRAGAASEKGSATSRTASLKGALDWLVPPLFRAGEYLVILALAARSGAGGMLPAAFGLVAAVAYHHYDTVYRIRGGTGAPPRALVRAIGGHEGRLLVVAVSAALLAHTHASTLAPAALAGILALVVLTESVRFWISAGAPAVHDETGEPT